MGLNIEVVTPKIDIIEKVFDFGKLVTLESSAEKTLSLRNSSNVYAKIVFDLRKI